MRDHDHPTHRHPPIPGQRIFRSMVAVWLCFAVFLLRGQKGIPFYSVIAALQCLQPDTKEMGKVAKKRLVGTLIGAFWGLLTLLLELGLLYDGIPDEWSHFLLLGLFTGIVLYSTVLLKATEAAYFSAVVFLSIAVNHIGDANPYLFAFNRMLDTLIGVLIAEIINRLHLPRLRNTDILFVSGIGDTILGADRKLSPYSKVELNRLIEDGARFTISTSETQATVRELLAGVKLPYPIITMNGAALYRLDTMEYLRTVPMRPEKTARLLSWTDELSLGCFSNSVEQNLLVVRYDTLANEGMEQIFREKRSSPYRNYVQSKTDPNDDVLYLFVVDTKDRIEQARKDFQSRPWAEEYRIEIEATDIPGYAGMKIYDADVSKEAMLEELKQLMGMEKTVTMGSIQGHYDVYIPNADRDFVVKELKRRFEPVSIRGWRNMFRL